MTTRKKRKKSTKRTSPMKGRKISEEDRPKDAPKLGRAFTYGEPAQKHVVTLSLPEGMMTEFLEKVGTDSQAQALTIAMYGILKKKPPKKLAESYKKKKEKLKANA
jgi:hypothetical protein